MSFRKYIGIIIRSDEGLSIYNNWLSSGLFLFLGRTDNITGDRFLNEVIGSSDYLTISGTGNSRTYKAPDTNEYKTADEDHVWFTEGGVQRTVTTLELVDSDFTRTPIYYDSISPYTVRWVGIFKSTTSLTQEQIESLYSSFLLSMFWEETPTI
jgi:hypothetical protein